MPGKILLFGGCCKLKLDEKKDRHLTVSTSPINL
jgi:hypothetical protein